MSVAVAADEGMAVTTRGLRKTFRTVRGTRVAVQGLDLDVPSGGVHGFLGPNGSGKTTTIRMLLGLSPADSGTMHIFGTPVPQRLPEVVNRVGAIVESPKFFPTFSAERNLGLLAEAIGTPRSRVGEVLEEVGLGGRGKDTFRAFSLGMKQRLAIAATLLKSPDLLIFDEPTNGLDPAGITEIRGTMRRLADEGRTVLVSSHILSEVEQIADTVSIIGRGRVLAQGSVAGLIGGGGGTVEVGVRHPGAAVRILREAGFTAEWLARPRGADAADALRGLDPDEENGLLQVTGAEPAEISRVLGQQGLWVERLVPSRRGLEQIFLELTQGEGLPAPSAHRPTNDASGGQAGPPPPSATGPGGEGAR
ncbi:ATP-binding cassette domain-containing protein [Ornithinimicrobium cerasi]|uniref:ABC-2 type transport system ATP-binding protein n=1 Tax=Ornithinimicrobium cerasi TaxID=2248773 RepID=A0A285VCE2_9MICO|nr:ATP-binding cassette domain-containing protein [Ornithinimicrobium cerasi]SOC51785.1 ABC-2 type transport system ATP-binding protein [Ornithinimicrobium cerasi]